MSRIQVFCDGGFLAHVTRPLEIAKCLRTVGHQVQVRVTGAYAGLARDAGFETQGITTVPVDAILARSRVGRTDWYSLEHIRDTVAADLAAFDEFKPDLVLGDFRHSLHTSCEMARVPLAVVLNASWTNYYSVVFRAPEHLWITRVLGKSLATRLSPWVKRAILAWDVGAHNQYRKQRGLAPFSNVWDMFSGDLNLITDIPEYGPTENLPANYRYVGPVVWEPEIDPPGWLATLQKDRPTVYVTMGSTGHGKYLKSAFEVFADTEYQCLMTTAQHAVPSNVPQNFHVCDYASGSQLLAKSDVVVCQGGNGTIYQALQQGVPIIGIPTMHDQEFNLQRVTDLGVGVELSDLKFRPQHLRQAVEQVLANPEMRAAARSYQALLAKYDGPLTAARLITEYLDRPGSLSPLGAGQAGEVIPGIDMGGVSG